MTVYTYGDTTIHDGINYFLQSKSKNMAPIATTTFKASRLEGTKKTGDTVDDVIVTVSTIVAGTSRAQLLSLIDTLYAGLALRQQFLSIHDTDSRYYLCDCTEATLTLQVGRLLQAVVAMKFRAYQPFAYAGSATTFSFASAALSAVSGQLYTTGTQTLPGGGNIYARPTITYTNNTPVSNMSLNTALTNGTPTSTIQVASISVALVTGDAIILSSGGHTQTVYVTAPAGTSGSPVTVSVASAPGGSNFTPNFSYPIGTTADKDTSITALEIIQNTDGMSITYSGLTGFTNGHTFVIDCDPTGTDGWTGLLDGIGSPWAFTGVFPVVEPGGTSIEFQVTSNSPPTVAVGVSWMARWLA